jgi:hypothetical protein
LLEISNELVHDKTRDGSTPLHLASRWGHLTIVESMIRRIFGFKNEAQSRKDYQDVTFLGRGSYGDVNKVKRIFDGALFAMKKTSVS